jgi:uncharacterized membrane protein YphA (DoxX/SURF4 family)
MVTAALLVLLRLSLAALFALAGVTKLASRQTFRATLGDLGVPRPMRSPLTVVLPVTELLAAILLATPFARVALVGSVAAGGLLVAFSTAAVIAVRRNTVTECSCFGLHGSEPLGLGVIARNAVLLAALAFCVVLTMADPEPGATGWWLEAWLAAPALVLGLALPTVMRVGLAKWPSGESRWARMR